MSSPLSPRARRAEPTPDLPRRPTTLPVGFQKSCAFPGDELAGHIAFEWFQRVARGLDHWYEEDEEIFMHPREPYKRVDALRSTRHVRVEIDGTVVADTHAPVLLLETRLPVRYYIPPRGRPPGPLHPHRPAHRLPLQGHCRVLVPDGRRRRPSGERGLELPRPDPGGSHRPGSHRLLQRGRGHCRRRRTAGPAGHRFHPAAHAVSRPASTRAVCPQSPDGLN